MSLLDTYSTPMTAAEAAHLLRRATVGPTRTEITAFTGLTASQAYGQLLANVEEYPVPVIVLDKNDPDFGKALNLQDSFNGDLNFGRLQAVRFWWIYLMTRQNSPPSLLEKLTMFWQNHFVVSNNTVEEHRFVHQYFRTIRQHALGNFGSFVKAITTDPAMLEYLNGHQNESGAPNENYARELQELFTVGEKDFYGNPNYNENDVKEAARVLTGWKHRGYWWGGTTSISVQFFADKHDTGLKRFSTHYSQATIAGVSGSNGGVQELDALVNMLLAHPQTARFICRKLFRWYVTPNVTATIEEQVVAPLADMLRSNGFQIEPVLRRLLTSRIFFDIAYRGAIVKSPMEMIMGGYRHFHLAPPHPAQEPVAAEKYLGIVWWVMHTMQMGLLDQSSVFGYEPYYQGSRSKGWVTSATLALRYQFADWFIWPWLEVSPGYLLGLDLVQWVRNMQPNFSNPTASPPVSPEQILASFSQHLFAHPLATEQQNFLIDNIMMQGIPRQAWSFEWNRYRTNPGNTDNYNGVRWRLSLMMRHMLRMAEYQIF